MPYNQTSPVPYPLTGRVLETAQNVVGRLVKSPDDLNRHLLLEEGLIPLPIAPILLPGSVQPLNVSLIVLQ